MREIIFVLVPSFIFFFNKNDNDENESASTHFCFYLFKFYFFSTNRIDLRTTKNNDKSLDLSFKVELSFIQNLIYLITYFGIKNKMLQFNTLIIRK